MPNFDEGHLASQVHRQAKLGIIKRQNNKEETIKFSNNYMHEYLKVH